MKATDITPGNRYRIAVTIPPGPSTSRMRATKHATVLSVERSTITIEVLEPVCTNLDDLGDVSAGYAMVNGLLRWERQAVRRQVRATDVLGPVTPDVEPASPAPATELAEVGS